MMTRLRLENFCTKKGLKNYGFACQNWSFYVFGITELDSLNFNNKKDCRILEIEKEAETF